MNSDISDFLLKLYISSRELSVEDFKQSVMEQLQGIIQFDSALWFTGSTVTEHAYPQNVHLYKQPDEMIMNYKAHQSDDPLLQALIDNPGKSINIRDIISYDDWIQTDNYYNHCSKFDIEWVLSTLLLEEHTSLFHAVSFYRNKNSQPFDSQDCQLKQLLVPHIVEAMKANLFIHIELASEKKASKDTWVSAVCDHRGSLIQADKQFATLLSNSFPHWVGPALPFTLEEKNQGKTISNEGLLINTEKKGDMLFIRIQQSIASFLERLTPQEINIARLLQRGLTNKEMAKQLGISPATIKNHISNIARKLNVSRRSQINHCLASVLQ